MEKGREWDEIEREREKEREDGPLPKTPRLIKKQTFLFNKSWH